VAPNAIFGPPVSRFNFHPSPQYRMIRVFFQPGAVFRLFGVPLTELTNHCIDAESLVGGEAAQVNERLANAATYEQMIEIVNAYLLCKISCAKRAESSLDKVATYLWANPTRFSLDWLADQSCLSVRQFNRRFTERMGIGPKLCSRIARYYRAYQFREANPKTDWLSVALWFGYTDVHHMAKDFKEFAGVTPNQLLNENRQSPELLLKLR
nr:AraC family transcriptional regulator [Cytophagales bacterium]